LLNLFKSIRDASRNPESALVRGGPLIHGRRARNWSELDST
jgi:hypothetical protein